MTKEEKTKMLVTYICYPFDVPEFYTTDEFARIMHAFYALSWVPILSMPYIAPAKTNLLKVGMSHALILKCDQLAICHEEHTTSAMLREINFAKANNVKVTRIYFKKKEDEEDE